jgi:putative FmdB family regulatory protein
MPIYEYTCEECNCDFEMLVTSTDDRHVTCPKCDSNQVNKLLSRACIGGSIFGSCAPGGSGGFS